MPVLSHSFRICFLVAALWAAAIVPLWLLAYAGQIVLSEPYGDLGWHAHELIFGYVSLVICGFLFTAIPNWTGRPPLRGAPLLGLVLLWLAGRVAIASASQIGVLAAAIIDNLFLLALTLVAAREIIGGGNRNNLVVVALVTLFLGGNIWFHQAVLTAQPIEAPLRAAISVLIVLIVLIGGRILPNFTRNWLARQNAKRLPALPTRLDQIAPLICAAGLAAWTLDPSGLVTGFLAATAAMALLARQARWYGWATWREPLLIILHIGYLFVPIGFALVAGGAFFADIVPAGAALHAWTVGAVGVMTLAVMTRASLGHTGRALTASPATNLIYLCILMASIARVGAPFMPVLYLPALVMAASAWTFAFAGFVAIYGPILIAPRLERAAG